MVSVIPVTAAFIIRGLMSVLQLTLTDINGLGKVIESAAVLIFDSKVSRDLELNEVGLLMLNLLAR